MKNLLLLLLSLILFACNNPPSPVPPNPIPDPGPLQEYETGLIKPEDREYGVVYWTHSKERLMQVAAEEEFDWEAQGFQTPVRDQGNCGSCWAFGGTQTLEMAYRIFANKIIDFSEQDLVGKLYSGCGGGYFTGKFQVETGQLAEADCKYSASNKKCSTSLPKAGKGAQWGLVGKPSRYPSDDEMKAAIKAYGAISVTVGANSSFMNLKGGFATSCPHSSTNHIVALVGWKTSNGKTFFKIKNSWGTGWGAGGYSYVPLGCWNLAEEASWIAIDAVPGKPPAIKMPVRIEVVAGDEIVLAVKNIQGVTYQWFDGQKKIGDGPLVTVTPTADTVYRVVAKNQFGEAEIQTLVVIRK